MHEAIQTNLQSRETRQNNPPALSQRHRRGGIRHGAIRNTRPAYPGFSFRLALLQRNNATTHRINGPRLVIEPPHFPVAFA